MNEQWSGTNHPEVEALIDRAITGDQAALAALFERFRARLERMVETRLDRRVRGRVDVADVLQDTYVRLSERLNAYRDRPELPFFVWLRLVTGDCLNNLHRHHLGAEKRNAGVEVSLHRGPMPVTDSVSLAQLLLGKETTASQKLVRAEAQIELQEAINALDPIDREVLALRHFEALSSLEAAQVLEIDPAAVSMRLFRALRRLKRLLGPKA